MWKNQGAWDVMLPCEQVTFVSFCSRVEIFCSRVSCFLCCSEDGPALFWRLGALRVAVLTRSRLLVFRILLRGGVLLGAFSAGPAPPFVQLWARAEVRSGSVAKLSLGQLLHFRAFAFPSEKPSRDCSVAQSSGAARRVTLRNSWQLRELVEIRMKDARYDYDELSQILKNHILLCLTYL